MIRGVNRPLQVIKNVISQSFPDGLERVEKKGRVFISRPFIVKGGIPKPAGQSPRRYYVRVFIRGGQRPYSLDIEGIEERRKEGAFQRVGRRDWIAKGVVQIIYEKLNKHGEQMNIIDDFRPF